jgi:hypothetical protein
MHLGETFSHLTTGGGKPCPEKMWREEHGREEHGREKHGRGGPLFIPIAAWGQSV